MITVKKMKDDVWMQTWYFAEATKMGRSANGKTRQLAVMNLKAIIKDVLRAEKAH